MSPIQLVQIFKNIRTVPAKEGRNDAINATDKIFSGSEIAPDSYWESIIESNHEIIPFSYWMSLGRGREYALQMKRLQAMLQNNIRTLISNRLNRGFFSVRLNATIFLYFDEKLFSRWDVLFRAMGG